MREVFGRILAVTIAAVLCFASGCTQPGRVPETVSASDGWQVFDDADAKDGDAPAGSEPSSESEEPDPTIMVYITGEVENPGVYELESGSRIVDAVEAAGGATSEAALEAINLSERIADEEHIIMPKLGEEPPPKAAISKPPDVDDDYTPTQERVNINTATSAELQTLSGIGPVTAAKIIEYREANGGFKTIADIKKVNRIGEKTFEALKDYITVD